MPTHPARQDLELTAVFHALSDPVRLGIVIGLLGAIAATAGNPIRRLVA